MTSSVLPSTDCVSDSLTLVACELLSWGYDMGKLNPFNIAKTEALISRKLKSFPSCAFPRQWIAALPETKVVQECKTHSPERSTPLIKVKVT